jgi:hypothetical protein
MKVFDMTYLKKIDGSDAEFRSKKSSASFVSGWTRDKNQELNVTSTSAPATDDNSNVGLSLETFSGSEKRQPMETSSRERLDERNVCELLVTKNGLKIQSRETFDFDHPSPTNLSTRRVCLDVQKAALQSAANYVEQPEGLGASIIPIPSDGFEVEAASNLSSQSGQNKQHRSLLSKFKLRLDNFLASFLVPTTASGSKMNNDLEKPASCLADRNITITTNGVVVEQMSHHSTKNDPSEQINKVCDIDHILTTNLFMENDGFDVHDVASWPRTIGREQLDNLGVTKSNGFKMEAASNTSNESCQNDNAHGALSKFGQRFWKLMMPQDFDKKIIHDDNSKLKKPVSPSDGLENSMSIDRSCLHRSDELKVLAASITDLSNTSDDTSSSDQPSKKHQSIQSYSPWLKLKYRFFKFATSSSSPLNGDLDQQHSHDVGYGLENIADEGSEKREDIDSNKLPMMDLSMNNVLEAANDWERFEFPGESNNVPPTRNCTNVEDIKHRLNDFSISESSKQNDSDNAGIVPTAKFVEHRSIVHDGQLRTYLTVRSDGLELKPATSLLIVNDLEHSISSQSTDLSDMSDDLMTEDENSCNQSEGLDQLLTMKFKLSMGDEGVEVNKAQSPSVMTDVDQPEGSRASTISTTSCSSGVDKNEQTLSLASKFKRMLLKFLASSLKPQHGLDQQVSHNLSCLNPPSEIIVLISNDFAKSECVELFTASQSMANDVVLRNTLVEV